MCGNKTLNCLIEFEYFVLVLSCFSFGHKACRSLGGTRGVLRLGGKRGALSLLFCGRDRDSHRQMHDAHTLTTHTHDTLRTQECVHISKVHMPMGHVCARTSSSCISMRETSDLCCNLSLSVLKRFTFVENVCIRNVNSILEFGHLHLIITVVASSSSSL